MSLAGVDCVINFCTLMSVLLGKLLRACSLACEATLFLEVEASNWPLATVAS